MKKLVKKDIEDIYTLTPLQEGMLFHYLKNPDGEGYSEQLSLEISGELDIKIFEKAWKLVVETNEMLRTLFRWEMVTTPVQIVLKKHNSHLTYHDFSFFETAKALKEIEKIKSADSLEPFDLTEVPLRIQLCKIKTDIHILIISNHHILYDGWSNGIILDEFLQAYRDLLNNKSSKKRIKTKYKEFVRLHREKDNSAQQKEQEYWREYFKGHDSLEEISIKRRIQDIGQSVPTIYKLNLPKEFKSRLDDFSRSYKLTPATILYGAWGYLLQRYCDCNDVVFGTTISGRTAKISGIEDMVGLFINTLPLRMQSDEDEQITDSLHQLDKTLHQREPHDTSSLVKIKEYAMHETGTELFDTILVVENYPLGARLKDETGPLKIQSYSMTERTHYDLTVSVTLFGHSHIRFIYDGNIFSEATIPRLAGHYARIIEGILEKPTGSFRDLNVLDINEKKELLYCFNVTGHNYPTKKTIDAIFEEQAARTPDHIALSGYSSRLGSQLSIALTYRELDEISTEFARYLMKRNLHPGDLVGILAERSLETIIGILGILKARVGYVPLNPKTPIARNIYILDECNITVVVTLGHLLAEIETGNPSTPLNPLHSYDFISIDSIIDSLCLSPESKVDETAKKTSGDLKFLERKETQCLSIAYVIFTSGSTGKPKGVPITHACFSPLIHWGKEVTGIGNGDRILQNVNICFDWSVWEMFIALLTGAELCVMHEDEMLDSRFCVDYIHEYDITTFHATPTQYSYITNLNPMLNPLKYLFLGGEKLGYDMLLRTMATVTDACRVFNMYGPTETTIISTALEISRSNHVTYASLSSVPIGTPVANATLLVLDRNLNPVPFFVPGELYIGGDGVAPGYLNDQNKSHHSFIPNPFINEEGQSPILYKTGDRVRRLPSGDLEFLGRTDYQVKIRGFRIELGEIENQLLSHPEIKETVVVPQGRKSGDKYLCAYFVLNNPNSKNGLTSELEAYCSKRLPDYMVPVHFIERPAFPLTPNGKTDLKALPIPETRDDAEYIAPRNDIEKKLAENWATILETKQDTIGIHSDFFRLGGHSLKATLLTSRIQKTFKVKVPLAKLFEIPRLDQMADFIRKATKKTIPAIPTVEKREYYSLSPAQKRMFVLHQIDKYSTGYNTTGVFQLNGNLDRKRLETTILTLINRHESFRTSFKTVNGQPVQFIHDEVEFEVEYGNTTEDYCPDLSKFITPFDLSLAPLIRIIVIKTCDQENIMIVDMHHIISDGLSTELFISEFGSLYQGDPLPPQALQYKDFAQWVNSIEGSEIKSQQADYWHKMFAGEVPILDLPIDFPRPSIRGFSGDSVNFNIGITETEALKTFAINKNATLYMLILAIFNIFLTKITNQETIVVGSPVAGRKHPDLQKIIGMFVNTLPLKNTVTGKETFSEFLEKLKTNTLNALANQDYPYEQLVEKVAINRDTSRNPLFDVMFSFETLDLSVMRIPGIEVSPYGYQRDTAKFDLSLYALEKEKELSLTMEYGTKLFKRDTIKRFCCYFKKVVELCTQNPETNICDITLLSEREKEHLLEEFNNPVSPYPKHQSLYQLFMDQVEKAADNEAVTEIIRYDDSDTALMPSLSYRQLEDRSYRLAGYLRKSGVRTGTVVALMLDRSIEMVVGIYSILAAGGTYLPIDPNLPISRIRYLLKDSCAKFLLTRGRSSVTISDLSFDGIQVDLLQNYLYVDVPATPLPKNSANNPAYVIYTSGSTGLPKGVIIEHRSVVNILFALQEKYPLHPGDTYLLKTTYSFDVSVTELFGWFLGCGRLAILESGAEKDPDRIITAIETIAITHINFVPSMFRLFLDSMTSDNIHRLSSLKYIFLAGEALQQDLVERSGKLFSGNIRVRLENIYGPTEATIYATAYSLTGFNNVGSIPIGTSLPNVNTAVLDKYGNLQPAGIAGELCIGGICLSRGYMNRVELTMEKFGSGFRNLPPTAKELTGYKLYRTGDLVRRLRDGNIEFLGRLDHQVKIRGFRIELGEIENYLLGHDGIKEAVVMVRNLNTDDSYICAYFVPVGDHSPDDDDLRQYLETRLPYYMIPTYFVCLESIPLTVGGKTDRKALAEPERHISTIYIAPRNKIEKQLVRLWSEVLELEEEKISIDDNFFKMGGHSLRAISMQNLIHKTFNVIISMNEIFKSPTISGLASIIKDSTGEKFVSIHSAEKREYYPLSSSQSRLFTLQQIDELGTGYNMPSVFILEGQIDKDKMEAVFRKLITRHEILRTSFHLTLDGPVQKVHSSQSFIINSSEITDSQSSIKNTVKRFIRPFTLSRAPLFRVGLTRVNDTKHMLMVDMHHIIADGASLVVMLDQFMALYRGEKLADSQMQYRDFATWQSSAPYRMSRAFKDQEVFWTEQLSEEIVPLDLPVDFTRPALQSFEGSTVSFGIPGEESKLLRTLARENNATTFMVLLSIYTVLLSKLSGRDDIIVGVPVSGRTHGDLTSIIGMFVNTLPIRNYVYGTDTFTGFLEKVKESTTNAFSNQDYPYENMVEILSIDRNIGRNPLFDTMFSMDIPEMPQFELPGITIKDYDLGDIVGTAKFDLTLTVADAPEHFLFTFEYATKLFARDTVQRFATHFQQVITFVLNHPGEPVSRVEVMSDEQKIHFLSYVNRTQASYPQEKRIHQLFDQQAEKTPDTIALIFKDTQLTYRALKERSLDLSAALVQKGAGPGEVVAFASGRSVDMVAGILAVLRTGAVYMPIDPQYPEERIRFMSADSNARLLLTASLPQKGISFNGATVDCSDILIGTSNGETCLPKHRPSIDSNAYIIYTSGSTGQPKGVLVKHKSIINLTVSQQKRFEITPWDRILLFYSISFDASLEQLFLALCSGAALLPVTRSTLLDPGELQIFLNRQAITHLDAVPLFLTTLNLQSTSSIRRIVSGGDVCPVSLAKKISRHHDFYNFYGPTETTVSSLGIKIEKIDENRPRLPIGKPISNTTVYIFDKWMQLVPTGVVGELYIGGDGVAEGYLNRPELTAEKFVENPYIPGERLYRTGDLAGYLPSGNIEFYGRVDHQVKIRGFRIETGEIEAKLKTHKRVKQALVVPINRKDGDKFLCAYVVPSPLATTTPLSMPQLQEFLAPQLPPYMIPEHIVLLDSMPLNPSGKINRDALPYPVLDAVTITSGGWASLMSETQKTIAEIWSEILDIDKKHIGRDSHFFRTGGHSLKGTQLITRLHKAFHIRITLQQLFTHPTIEELSCLVDETAQPKIKYREIKMVEERDYYALSPAQQRIFLLQQMDPGNIHYNMASTIRLSGKPRKQKLEDTLRHLIERHESLRTSFHMLGEKPIQVIHSTVDLGFKLEEGTASSSPLTAFVRPFDLSHPPLLRVRLVDACESGFHDIMVDTHHIIFDGISAEILKDEFTRLYNGETLQPLKIRYRDYAEWQNHLMETGKLKSQEEYWHGVYSGNIPVLQLPTDYSRPPVRNFEGDVCTFFLNERETQAMQHLAVTEGVTLFMITLSILNIFLAKLSRSSDIIVGTAVDNRRHDDLQNIIGMFVNTLALRNFPIHTSSFNEFLADVKKRTLTAYENSDYPFEELVEAIATPRDLSRNPLFDIMFAFQNISMADTHDLPVTVEELTKNTVLSHPGTAKFDLTLIVTETGNTLNFHIEYCTRIYKKETIERYITYFKKIANTVLQQPGIPISQINLMPEDEKKRVLEQFNDTTEIYPVDTLTHHLFEEQVIRTPNNPVVVDSHLNTSITYKELDKQANQAARMLLSKGVGQNNIIGVLLERSIDIVVAILGILKAGCAYVPIDIKYPASRIRYILNDSAVNVLITRNSNASANGKPIDTNHTMECTDLTDGILSAYDSTCPDVTSSQRDLMYVIYTSGSTGNPKGVAVEHKGFVNLLRYYKQCIDVNSSSRMTQVAGAGFDAMALELFPSLVNGAVLHIVPDEICADAIRMKTWLLENRITISFQSTFVAEQLIKEEWPPKEEVSLRALLTGGDRLSQHPSQPLPFDFFNLYGPTEDTVWTTVSPVQIRPVDGTGGDETFPDIGRPVANHQVYIVDESLQPQPIGVPGELCVSGIGLARGYLNQPQLTIEKFVPKGIPGETTVDNQELTDNRRMYRTGDLAVWLPDGRITFIGRIDHQVKIRGYRIELGEIENTLVHHKQVKEAVVTVIQDNTGDKHLCAYFIAVAPLEITELRDYLNSFLPLYMIPSYFMQLSRLPLTPNGKIDRKALPYPAMAEGSNVTAPRNEIEQMLLEIWHTVLIGKNTHLIPESDEASSFTIGIDNNFFQLGGHSIKATRVCASIRDIFQVNLVLADLFKAPTIRELAEIIAKTGKNTDSGIVPVEKKEFYPVSYNQKRMWILAQLQDDNGAYNISACIRLPFDMDEDIARKALSRVALRHDSLRTGFLTLEDEPVQYVVKDIDIPFKYFDISTLYTDEMQKKARVEEIYQQESRTPFDLRRVPLFRSVLVKRASSHYDFIFVIHHIVSDGWSMQLVERDFFQHYQALKEDSTNLPASLNLQYKDFSVWHNEYLSHPQHKERAVAFWKQRFQSGIHVPQLPCTGNGDPKKSAGASFMRHLDPELSKKCLQMIRENNITPFALMFTLYLLVLHHLSKQADLTCSIISAGRDHGGIQNIVGFFVNSILFKTQIDEKEPFVDLILRINREVVDTFSHQDYPLELIFKELKMKYPEVPVSFNMLNIPAEGSSSEQVPDAHPLSRHNQDAPDVKFDIEVYCKQYENTFAFDWVYRKSLYQAMDIEYIEAQYLKLLEFFTAGSERSYSDFKSQKKKRKRLI